MYNFASLGKIQQWIQSQLSPLNLYSLPIIHDKPPDALTSVFIISSDHILLWGTYYCGSYAWSYFPEKGKYNLASWNTQIIILIKFWSAELHPEDIVTCKLFLRHDDKPDWLQFMIAIISAIPLISTVNN